MTCMTPNNATPLTLSPSDRGVIARVSKRLCIPDSEAEQRFLDTKRFLHLASISDVPLSPTRAIDEVWHEWLLHSRAYRDFCLTTHGKFLDHEPLSGTGGAGANFNRTIELARHVFGDKVATRWLTSAAGCSDCSPVTPAEPPPSDCAVNINASISR